MWPAEHRVEALYRAGASGNADRKRVLEPCLDEEYHAVFIHASNFVRMKNPTEYNGAYLARGNIVDIYGKPFGVGGNKWPRFRSEAAAPCFTPVARGIAAAVFACGNVVEKRFLDTEAGNAQFEIEQKLLDLFKHDHPKIQRLFIQNYITINPAEPRVFKMPLMTMLYG